MRPERARFCESCRGERLKRLPRSSLTILHSKSLLTTARRPLLSPFERATAARLPHSRMLIAHGAPLGRRDALRDSAPMTGGARRRRKSCCGRGRGTAQQEPPECSRYRAGRRPDGNSGNDEMKCDRWALRVSRDSQLRRMPNKFGIRHSAITVYCRRDYKRGSISRTNFCHSIIALCGGETSLVKRIGIGGANGDNVSRPDRCALLAARIVSCRLGNRNLCVG